MSAVMNPTFCAGEPACAGASIRTITSDPLDPVPSGGEHRLQRWRQADRDLRPGGFRIGALHDGDLDFWIAAIPSEATCIRTGKFENKSIDLTGVAGASVRPSRVR